MSPWRRSRDAAAAALLELLSLLTQPLGWRGSQRLGAALGAIGWVVDRRDRRRTLEHLRSAFPELPEVDCRRLGRASFRHHGTSLGECLYLLRRDPAAVDRAVEVIGWDNVERARDAKRPILILTGHCGNWELLAAALSGRNLKLRVVARRLDDTRFQRLLLRLRRRFGTETIERGEAGAARTLLRTLREGGTLGILIDQDTRVDGVWVPFLGRLAYTPTAAAQLAHRHRVAVLPAFIERLPGGQHRAELHPPMELPADLTAATAAMTRAIEEQVARVPEQWVWMHRRWRRRPPSAEE